MRDEWIAERMGRIEMSGIRKVFELARSIKDPINLSIGQPHFAVPQPLKDAAKAAIDADKNAYTVTQGIPELLANIRSDLDQRYGHADRNALITSGTAGGLLLSMFATINPGDEVILFDPYFVAYPHLVTMVGGVSVYVDTYPDFQIDPEKLEAAITPRTKAILLSSPSNPTGTTLGVDILKGIARVAEKHNLVVISDEIYRLFHYDEPARSVAEFYPGTVVVEGLGKTYSVTGWRLGYAHGPKRIIEEMTKLQQFTFICAPAPFQYAALAAEKIDMTPYVIDYRHKRDLILAKLSPRFERVKPGGAFYIYPQAPWGTATEFVTAAIKESLLIIPGSTFSRRDSHIRISFAAPDTAIERGIDILNRLAERGA